MNSRLKGFGFGKRKSTASIQHDPNLPQSQTPPPLGAPQIPHPFPSRPGPTPSIASTSSQQSLPMSQQGPGPRPPSYTPAGYPPGAAPVGRQSPMAQQGPARTPPTQMVGGPPPIHTGAPIGGYPPQGPMGGPPPGPGGPLGYAGAPGYPPTAPQPQGGMPVAPYSRSAAEVEGNSRSKAQLIVGIDFVSTSWCTLATDLARLTRIAQRAQRFPELRSRSLPITRPKRISSQSGRVRARIRNRRSVTVLNIQSRVADSASDPHGALL